MLCAQGTERCEAQFVSSVTSAVKWEIMLKIKREMEYLPQNQAIIERIVDRALGDLYITDFAQQLKGLSANIPTSVLLIDVTANARCAWLFSSNGDFASGEADAWDEFELQRVLSRLGVSMEGSSGTRTFRGKDGRPCTSTELSIAAARPASDMPIRLMRARRGLDHARQRLIPNSLYEKLKITSDTRLVIVATGGAAIAPITAFPLDDGFLIDKFSVLIAPGISTLVGVRQVSIDSAAIQQFVDALKFTPWRRDEPLDNTLTRSTLTEEVLEKLSRSPEIALSDEAGWWRRLLRELEERRSDREFLPIILGIHRALNDILRRSESNTLDGLDALRRVITMDHWLDRSTNIHVADLFRGAHGQQLLQIVYQLGGGEEVDKWERMLRLTDQTGMRVGGQRIHLPSILFTVKRILRATYLTGPADSDARARLGNLRASIERELYSMEFARRLNEQFYEHLAYLLRSSASLSSENKFPQNLNSRTSKTKQTTLIVGNPDMGWDKTSCWSPLPSAEAEARYAAQQFNSGRALLKRDASFSRVMRELKRAQSTVKYVYLATHGVSDAVNPADGSFLALSNGQLTGASLRPLRFTNAPLVVLSACQTGLGKTFPGGLFGLAQAWFHAGAQKTLMTLWNVNDGATGSLMRIFNEKLRARHPTSIDVDSAEIVLAEAIREFKKQSPDPATWAGIAMYGVPAR